MTADYTAIEAATDEARRHLHCLPDLPPNMPFPFRVGEHGHHPAWIGRCGCVTAALTRTDRGQWQLATEADVSQRAPSMVWEYGYPRAGAIIADSADVARTVTRLVRATQAGYDAMRDALVEPVCAHGCDPEMGVSCAGGCGAGPGELAAESDLDERTRAA